MSWCCSGRCFNHFSVTSGQVNDLLDRLSRRDSAKMARRLLWSYIMVRVVSATAAAGFILTELR